MSPLLLIGCGRHAQVVRDCLHADDRPIGYLDDQVPTGEVVEGLSVLGPCAALPDIARAHPGLATIVAIGDNSVRAQIVEAAERHCPGLVWARAIHASVILATGVTVGEGAVIAPGVVLSCHARIGRHALVNTGSLIDHDNQLGAFASTGPGVVTGGGVTIGPFSHVGIGATLRHGVHVGEHAVVGAHAYVDRDLPPAHISYGIPARPVRPRHRGERYL